MVALAERLSALWDEQHLAEPTVALGLAHLAAKNKDVPRALRFLERAAQGPTALQAWSLQAEVLQRNKEYRAAVEVLLRAVTASPQPAPLHLRLAKLYEHRLRDFDAALHHARVAEVAEIASVHASRKQRLLRRAQRAP